MIKKPLNAFYVFYFHSVLTVTLSGTFPVNFYTNLYFSGKHPVSALVELCSKRKWSPPDFEMVFDCGPDHKKNFLMKVLLTPFNATTLLFKK